MYLWSWLKAQSVLKYSTHILWWPQAIASLLKSKKTPTCCHFLKNRVYRDKKGSNTSTQNRKKNRKYKAFAYSATLSAWLFPGSRCLRLQTLTALPRAKEASESFKGFLQVLPVITEKNTDALEIQVYLLPYYGEMKIKVDLHRFLSDSKVVVQQMSNHTFLCKYCQSHVLQIRYKVHWVLYGELVLQIPILWLDWLVLSVSHFQHWAKIFCEKWLKIYILLK